MIWKTFIFSLLALGVLGDDIQIGNNKSQFKEMLTAQCKKNGAEDKVAEIEAASASFLECVKGLVNIEVLKNEIEEAKPNGALDEVFKKYCAKSPQLNGCIDSLLDGVSPCMDANGRAHIGTAKNTTRQLVDFICFKDGDRIALFIAEGGPECLRDQADAVKSCYTKVIDSVKNVENAKQLSDDEKCAKYDQTASCVVTELEKCANPTPGNMAESLFRFVRQGLPCKKKQS